MRNVREISSEEQLFYDVVETAVGYLILVKSNMGLRYVNFQNDYLGDMPADLYFEPTRLREETRQIKAYLAHDLTMFDLQLDVVDGTDFQKKVWQELCRIPYGKVITYGELAQRVGSPGASRAVGNANGRNPLVIIQPCHRVVASGGKIGGFSSGLHRKKFLLSLEKNIGLFSFC